jgi:hypothetical protein
VDQFLRTANVLRRHSGHYVNVNRWRFTCCWRWPRGCRWWRYGCFCSLLLLQHAGCCRAALILQAHFVSSPFRSMSCSSFCQNSSSSSVNSPSAALLFSHTTTLRHCDSCELVASIWNRCEGHWLNLAKGLDASLLYMATYVHRRSVLVALNKSWTATPSQHCYATIMHSRKLDQPVHVSHKLPTETIAVALQPDLADLPSVSLLPACVGAAFTTTLNFSQGVSSSVVVGGL